MNSSPHPAKSRAMDMAAISFFISDKLNKLLVFNDLKMVEVAGVEPASHDLS